MTVTLSLPKTGMVKAPNIEDLSILTSVGYGKKETNLKNCSQQNKVIIILYLHKVQNDNFFLISSNFALKCTTPLFQDIKNSHLTLGTFCKKFNNFSLLNYFYKIYQGK